jgi:phenylpropionate dioxygenase-like ring-hydroxylating dioxygenase large terminal subunit
MQMLERQAWYVAAWSSELRQRPLGRRLLGKAIVLFRDGKGQARALDARCPHRCADLAAGRIVGDCIECPFHGWQYDSSGRCVSIPSQPSDRKIPRAARVASHPVDEDQGAIWIWPGEGPPSPRRHERGEDDGDFWAPGRRVCVPPRLLRAPLLDVVEAQLDVAHVPFIHAGSLGRDRDPLVPRQRVRVASDAASLEARDDPDSPWRPTGAALSGLPALAARLLGQSDVADQRARFELPALVARRVEWANGTWDRFVSLLTPADPEHTWLFYETVRTRAPNGLGDRVQRWFMNKVAAEGTREADLVLVHDVASRTSVESDRAGLAARRLYAAWAGSRDAGPDI